jgi:hypothetical protein
VAREPIPDPIDDQPPACKFISSVGDEISADRRRFSVVLPKVHLPPRRYWEEALQEDPADYPIS